MQISNRFRQAVITLAAVLAVACAPLIAGYSLEAYRYATTLKAETLTLMAEADEPFAQHAEEIRTLRTRLLAAQEFAAGMPMNQLSARQWRIMNDPDGGLAGEFWVVWERQGTISTAARAVQIQQVSSGFDEIICLEANKEKNTRCVPAQ
ncbi:MAG TPA: hypothetical protein VES64_10995 [Allosphingosinicella sp.]|nr:hypothetical protein [Allosphingosinicella sp.]